MPDAQEKPESQEGAAKTEANPPAPPAAEPPPPVAAAPIIEPPTPPPGEPTSPIEIDPDDQASGVRSSAGMVQVPPSAFRDIKTREREKGRKQALEHLDEQAKAHGFDSLAGLFTTVKDIAAAKAAPAPEPPPKEPKETPMADDKTTEPTTTTTDRKLSKSSRRKMRQLREDHQKALAKVREVEKTSKQVVESKEQEIARLRAEQAVREIAIRAGVGEDHLDYALEQMRRHIKGLDEAARKEFDTSKYLEGVRKTQPYLFGEVTVPADTGNTTDPTDPAPPTAIAAEKQDKAATTVDATKMSKQEFQQYLREKNLRSPGVSH